MSNRKIYDVSPRGEKWSVKRRGAERALAVLDSKEAAIERACEVAKHQPLSQVVIRKRDGSIQSERTYGNDPYPPKG